MEMSHYDKKAKDLKVLLVTGKISENKFHEEIDRVQFELLEGIEVNSYCIDSLKARGQPICEIGLSDFVNITRILAVCG